MLQERREPQRGGVLDALKGIRFHDQPASSPAPAGAPAAGAPASAPPGAAPSPAQPAEATATPDEPVAAPETLPTPAEPVTPDPAEPPGLVQLRKQEQYARQKLAEERAAMLRDLEIQKSAWQTQVSEAEKLKTLLANARQDPFAAATAMGFTESDYEALGRLFYGASPEGQKDPRHKAAAHEKLAARAQQTALEKLEAKQRELADEIARRDAEAQRQANVGRYLNEVRALATEGTPHAKLALTRQPDVAQQRLLEIGEQMWFRSGPSDELREYPAPGDVLKAYEAERHAAIRSTLDELRQLGIDPATFGAAAPRPAAAPVAPAPAPAAAPAPATPAAPVAATPPAPAAPATPAQPAAPLSRDEVLAQLRGMRFTA